MPSVGATRTLAVIIASLSLAALGLSCAVGTAADSPPATDLPTVVVTYSVLAAVVGELVGGTADVVTLIPDGQDPHDFAPSAKDVEAINNAAFVVANGLHFEEGLDVLLDKLRDADGRVFFVGEHIAGRDMAEGGDHTAGHVAGHAATDPHLWLSPGAMLEMLPALTTELGTALNTDLTAARNAVSAGLTALDTEIDDIMAQVDNCKLITGHDELGYFADRYNCELLGAVIPSSTTTSEASAGGLAALKEVIDEHDAKVVFVGLGTPQAVSAQIVKETGVRLVELSTHVMGSVTSYADFMRLVANQLADALK